jgi:hypothetical protein
MLLPGLVAATAYVYFPRATAARNITGLEARIEEVRLQAPTLAAEARVTEELSALRRVAEELRRAAAPVAPAPRTHEDAASRAADVEAVLLLLARHDLTLTEESTGPIGIEAAASPLLRGVRGPVRTLRFRGGFFDVLAALNELVESGARAFPLQLEMKRSRDEEGALLWTLMLI